MPVVDTVDYISKRIYLHSDTVGVDLDTMDVYKEVRGLRVAETLTPYPHRNFKPMIVQGGNIRKTPTSLTAKYVQLLYGCRIVPYDVDHALRVIRDTFTDDGFDGRDCFDKTGLVNSVDIDYEVDKVEVVEVNTGSAVTAQDKTDIIDGVNNEQKRYWQGDEVKTPTTYQRKDKDTDEILVNKSYSNNGLGTETLD